MMNNLNVNNVSNDLVTKVSDFLSVGNFDDALALVNDNKYKQCLKDKSWDLIPLITKYLSQNTLQNSPDLFTCCEIILEKIATEANPEEALLEFLEQAELAESDANFLSLLKPLKIVLLRVPRKRGQSLEWCLNMILAYVNSLPLPDNHKLEGKEKLLLDADPNAERITYIYSGLSSFYKHFVLEISLKHKGVTLTSPFDRKEGYQRKVLACFILQLIGKPLNYLDLTHDDKTKSSSRIIAENLVEDLSLLVSDLFIFLEYAERRECEHNTKCIKTDDALFSSGEEDFMNDDLFANKQRVDTLSYSTLIYLLLAEGILLDHVPCVYNPIYIFQRTLYLVYVTLLQDSNNLLVYKSLLLMKEVLHRLVGSHVPSDVLDSPYHKYFTESLMKVMIYSEVELNRKLSVEILKSYLFVFDSKGQYLVMYNFQKIVNHSGVMGLLITQFKDMIANILDIKGVCLKYFSGGYFKGLLLAFCNLPNGAESDLVELGDQIVSALNLVRFLVLRDKDNLTGIWDCVSDLEYYFFEPLKRGLIISRAHFELKLKELKQERIEENKGMVVKRGQEVTITIGGQQLPNLPYENKVSVINSAFNAFDLMEGLLGRVIECISESKRKT